MKKMLAILLFPTATAVQAHESLVPHTHPHGISMLPDLGTSIVGGVFVLALALLAYAKLSEK